MRADRHPLICAHRGASSTLRDNSLAAFSAAIESRCEVIETDLRRAPDGGIVCAHDPADACREDAVDLVTLLGLTDGHVQLDLELKEPGFEAELLAMIGDDRQPIVSSFWPDVLLGLRELAPDLATGLLLEAPLERDPVELAQRVRANALIVEDGLLSRDLLERAACTGHQVWVWTVNEEGRLAEVLAMPLVSAVITDTPERAVAIRESLGRAGGPARMRAGSRMGK